MNIPIGFYFCRAAEATNQCCAKNGRGHHAYFNSFIPNRGLGLISMLSSSCQNSKIKNGY
jgi:hypothetical protein